ncbi:MAG: 2-oxo acid dehydrogenase subunit E2 [Candidatus Eisenbacteria bacterium]|nr:2-oxo acid dehydrogenase subunit E2 [Candidatus Eisenbacteria bacterium]
MPYDVKLPDIGEGIAEGEIVKWLVKAGDAVKEDQPLVEIMTDKASVEIPSPRTGTIAALHAEEGATVPVGSVIVSIALPGEVAGIEAGAAAATPGSSTTAHRGGAGVNDQDTSRWNNEGGVIPEVTMKGSAAPPAGATAHAAGTPEPGSGALQATPAVRALAKELGVALQRVRGSGPGGRIVADDVRAAAGGSRGAGGAIAPIAARPAKPDEPEERVPLRGLRRRIAEHMRRSLSTAAQFTFVAECDMTAVAEHRAANRARAEAAGTRLTYLAYVFRALIEPLRRFPLLNASLDDAAQEVVIKRFYHLGLATSTEDGLTVPILHHADRLSLLATAREIERLSKAARERHLKLEELQGGTFTVTSTGAHGGLLATPILHHPQVAILGVHEVKKKPAVVKGKIVARDMTNLSLSLDHRAVDGAVGADFLYALIARLERPDSWLTPGDLS